MTRNGPRAVLASLLAIGLLPAVPAHAAALTPSYGPVSIEPQDPNRQYRAMPSLQRVHWTDATGAARSRFIRSFLITADGASPAWHRIQYQDGSGVWREAKDAATGRPLYESDHVAGDNASVRNVFQTGSGAVVAMDSGARKDTTGRYLYRRTSADGGEHWSATKSYIDMTGATVAPEASGQAFQGVSRLPDGALMMPFYAVHKVQRDSSGRIVATWSAAHILTSTDDGLSWRRATTVFKSDTNTYSEATVTRRADGRLLMIARYDVWQGGYNYSRLLARVTTTAVNSAAQLATAAWNAAYPVQVPGAADEAVARGVAPILHTMDQGVIMLVFGRPRNKITFSHDGGATWLTVRNLYDNLPTNCSGGYAGHPCGDLGSSGYIGVAVTSSRTAYIMGDNCQSGWGCAGGYTYPHTTDDRLWLTTVRLA